VYFRKKNLNSSSFGLVYEKCKIYTYWKISYVFREFRFIRSTEMVYAAHKLDLLNVKGPKALEAALFATKFKGSSVSFDELKVLKKL